MILRPKPLTDEEKAERLKMAEDAEKEFLLWMLPFYKERIAEAMGKGWKASYGVSHVFMQKGDLRVFLGGGVYDNQKWLHLSVSREGMVRLPQWGELVRIKELFLGADTLAIKIIPPVSEYVNDFNVLHLWSPLDFRSLPDFRLEVGGKLSI